MTNKKLEQRKMQETLKFDTAIAINNLLAEAAKQAGLKGEDAQEYINEILELVNEED